MKLHRRKKHPMSKGKKDVLILLTILIVFVVFSLVLLPTLLIVTISGSETWLPERKNIDISVTVYLHKTGNTVTLDLEDYVAGVVAGEMPATFELEALKAQAVAARTYALSKITRSEESGNSADHPEAPLCDDTHCQVYRSEEELLKLKGQNWMEDGWIRIKDAVESTAGQVMFYNDSLVEQPLFHSSSGGKTENSEDVFVSALPYLRSVDSLYESEAPYQNETISISLDTFRKKVREAYGANSIIPSTIKILNRSKGGRVEQIQVGDQILTGRNIRDLFDLRSANFIFAFDGNNNIVITTNGYGHGVGMSQWGANGMAQAKFQYNEILKHYYSGVSIDLWN